MKRYMVTKIDFPEYQQKKSYFYFVTTPFVSIIGFRQTRIYIAQNILSGQDGIC